MNASLEWLRDFVAPDLGAKEIRDLLTARCATVEEMRPVRQDLGDIVIGRVVEAARHPESDHLWITKVDAGQGALLDVVCGAPNVAVGNSYPFAPVGATLPGGLKIEKRKIRGQLSNGMLCSSRELGLGTDHEGILALNTDASPGESFLDAVGAGDTLFVVDVNPNRPDLLSHRGIAREVAAATKCQLREFQGEPWSAARTPAELTSARGASGAIDGVTVTIEDTDGCARYSAVIIRGARVAPSPDWLSRRLAAIGARSINNVVDVTNYMLHGYGQPMHAFDLGRFGAALTVRRAREGEKLLTLDGVERTLRESMTVIAGADCAEAIAGVIGGKGTEVTDATTDILLEVAIFDPRRVRATRRVLGISTDASYRFERHVDPEQGPELAARAAALIAALTGGKVSGGIDVYPSPPESQCVSVRPARASLVIGDPIPASAMTSYLSSVGFAVIETSPEVIMTTVPSWRSDVTAEVDLIEEIARLHGYDRVSTELRPFRPGESPDSPMWLVEKRVRDALVAEGMLEARPMPFVAEGRGTDIRLRNPLAENEAYLRGFILETLARRAEYNLGRMQGDVRLFEIGTVFQEAEDVRPGERQHVGVLLMGDRRPRHFTESKPPSLDLWDAKWIAEVIVRVAFGAGDIKFRGRSSPGPLLTVTLDGAPIGHIGPVPLDAPAWAAAAFGVEIDLSGASQAAAQLTAAKPLPNTPAVQVDIALITPDDLPADRVAETIRSHAGELLESLELFDEFRGAGLEAGHRSLAWRLTFRHPERTLRDKEIDARRTKLLRALEGELGVRQRTS